MTTPTLFRFLSLGALAALAGGAVALGFAFWTRQSGDIFLSLVEGGFSWCF